MSQTTMKIDRDVLADLKELATDDYRTPQKELRFLIDAYKAQKQQERLDIIHRVEASEALEGYDPLTSGVAYDLRQQWVRGEITLEEEKARLLKHYGLDKTPE